jgi:hypothetical protein
MTSISPHKLIRFEKYPLKKGPVSSRQANPVGHHSRQSKKLSDQLYPVANLSAGINFEGQLRTFENIARHEYLKISKSLSFPKLPPWFRQRLEQGILPTLNRIGFDESFGRILFAMAASPWQVMGPANKKIRVFHPGIDQEIEEIRRGLLMQANEIATPWIVLPRAFSFLKEQDGRYLPAYLKTIDRETNEHCLKLFIRIAVEFVGNYALKFANNRYPPNQLAKLLYYGFSAMLWKNLRCPPEGMENCAVFDNFLNWINMLARKSDFLGREEMKSIDQMIEMKTTAFPTRNFAHLKNRSREDASHFVVTLRHGYLGIAAVLKYFGMDQFSETRLARNGFPGRSMLNELHGLLHAIQTSYHSESIRTQEYIKHFLCRLRSICDLMPSNCHPTAHKFLKRRFKNLQILFTNY